MVMNVDRAYLIDQLTSPCFHGKLVGWCSSSQPSVWFHLSFWEVCLLQGSSYYFLTYFLSSGYLWDWYMSSSEQIYFHMVIFGWPPVSRSFCHLFLCFRWIPLISNLISWSIFLILCFWFDFFSPFPLTYSFLRANFNFQIEY